MAINDRRSQDWLDVMCIRLADVPADAHDEATPFTVAGATYFELPDMGWGALAGWLAGTARMLRCLEERDRPVVVVTCTRRGQTTETSHTQTDAERAEIDDAVDLYLADAGVPPRPRGYRWFVRLPAGYSDGDAFFTAINAAMFAVETPSGHPSHLVGPMAACIETMYREGDRAAP